MENNKKDKTRWKFLKNLKNLALPKVSDRDKEYDKYVSLLSQARFWAEIGDDEIEQGMLEILSIVLERKIKRYSKVRDAQRQLEKEANEYLDRLAEPKVEYKVNGVDKEEYERIFGMKK